MDATAEWMSLAPGELVAVDDAAGIDVFVVAGEVWLTQRRDERDLVLRAGASLRVAPAAALVVSSRRGATLRLRRLGSAQASRPGTWLARLHAAVEWLRAAAARNDRAARIG